MTDSRPRRRAALAQRHVAPVAAAGVVLLLWFAWLLLPVSEAQQLVTSIASPSTPVTPSPAASQLTQPTQPSEPTEPTEPSASTPPAADPGTLAAEAQPPEPSVPEPEPDVPVVPQAGTGVFAVAPGGTDPIGAGDLVTYTVEIEEGVALDAAEVAAIVDGTLAEPRSWTAQGRWSFQRVGSDPDARILLASPATTDALCAPLRTNGEYSCRNGQNVVLNAVRWTEGAETWGAELVGYRGYLVNHEFGHFLGNGHTGCPAAGQPAPVMMQQTIRLDGCLPSSWPYP